MRSQETTDPIEPGIAASFAPHLALLRLGKCSTDGGSIVRLFDDGAYSGSQGTSDVVSLECEQKHGPLPRQKSTRKIKAVVRFKKLRSLRTSVDYQGYISRRIAFSFLFCEIAFLSSLLRRAKAGPSLCFQNSSVIARSHVENGRHKFRRLTVEISDAPPRFTFSRTLQLRTCQA